MLRIAAFLTTFLLVRVDWEEEARKAQSLVERAETVDPETEPGVNPDAPFHVHALPVPTLEAAEAGVKISIMFCWYSESHTQLRSWLIVMS